MVDIGAGDPFEGEAQAGMAQAAADAEIEPEAAEEEDDMKQAVVKLQPKPKTKRKPVAWEHVQTSASGDYYWAEAADSDGMPVVEMFVTRGENLSKPAWTWSVRFIGDNSRIWGTEFFGRAADAQAAVVAELPEIMTDPRICD